MTRSRAVRTRSPKPGSVLERLEADEARAVRHRLLAAHPDLRTEAERAARSLLSQVSFESGANDVERALRSLALDPFLADMKRQMELGLRREALEICKGVVLGLYRIRDTMR